MKNLLPFLLIAIGTALAAQEEPMEVYRGNAIKYSAIVFNFHVDESNNKWVGTADGLFKVHDPTLASRVELAEGEESLLRIPDGNQDIRWKKEDLIAITGDIFDRANYITTGHYDVSRKELWLGTSQFGLYRFKADPKLELIEQYTIYNSKLKSDFINTIYIDAAGRQWVGTKDGVLYGEKGRWQLLQRGADIKDIAGKGLEVWWMAEDEVGPLDARQRWEPIELPRFKTEGRLRNITFDDKGNLWIASEIITRYNTESQEFTIFGPAQEYTSQFASCLAADRDNAIWVGTQDKGLYIIDKASALRVTILPDQEISCNGNGKDASLKVEVYGGQEPYTYKWSGDQSGPTLQNLAPGEYQLTVTDAKGKSKTTQAIVEDKRVEAVAAMIKNESGPGATDGSASVKVKGGTPPYTYRWDNGETLSTATKLSAGQHNVTVTDKAGCQSVSSLSITQELAELSANLILADEVKCFGGQGATLEVEATGGKEPYDFNWSQTSLAGARVKGLTAGAYAVTVTDAAGNETIAQTTIPQPDALNATATAMAPASTGEADGQARVNATGGTPGYQYVWDSSEKGENSDDLAAGRHTVTVTDANGCTAVANVNITEDILPLTLAIQQTAGIDCFGGNQAGLQVQIEGGKGPFQYQWSQNGLFGQTPAGLAAGDYSVTVTDAAGNTQSAQASIPQPGELKATATATAPASTGNADGQASVNANGGNGGFSFQWDNGENTAQAKQLAPGTHTVTVTDAKGCTTTATVEISENILPLTLAVQQTAEVNCFGGKQAALQVQANGGKGPFQYQWNSDGLTGQAPAGLAAGDYMVTVTDAAGNTQTAQASIPQPGELKATATATAPASTGNADGQASVNAAGGNGNFSFQWDNGENTAQAAQLAPGTHTVTVTDAKGCTATATVEISENILPLALAIQQTAEIDCFGGKQAALQVQANGGKGPFQYQWNSDGLTGQAPAGLAAGDYTVTVTDAAGNSQTAQASVPQPGELKATAAPTAPSSTGNADGQASVNAAGGNGNFSFQWDNGENTAQATQLAPGTHTVTVTDAKGCTATATVEISENILPLTLAIQQTAEIDCFGGKQAALQVQANGGKGPFQYQWNSDGLTGQAPAGLAAGDYTVTVTDAAGNSQSAQASIPQPGELKATATATAPASTGNADGQASVNATGGNGSFSFQWDSGENTAQATQLAPGTHTVTVTDAKGCTATASVEISENILPLTLAIQQTAEINCFGGKQAALQVQANGGKGPFQYQWNSDGLTGQAPAGLAAGDYMVTVTDAAGNTQTAQASIPQPGELKATATATAPSSTGNADGQASVNAAGGNGNFSFQWDSGENTAQAKQLAPGTHTVTVTDAKGCTATATVEISENILPLTLAIQQTAEIDCFGGKQAALQVQANGGKGPFQYQWNSDGLTGQAPAGLAAGDYMVTVTDAAGNSQSAQASVPQPGELKATATATAPASTGNADGQASVNANGGNGGFSFQWDNGENTAQATQLAPGTHTVTVTDAKGCTATATVEISENILPLTLAIQQTAEIDCFGGKQAALQVQANGGKGPFQYQWNSEGLSGQAPAGLAAGDYTVTVTDAAGNTQTAQASVPQPGELKATATATAPASTGNADGQASVNAAGGNSGFSFQWDNGENTAQATQLAPGTHTVTVTDAKGCTATATVEISENILPLTLAIQQTAEIDCFGGKQAALQVQANGGKGPFQYQWNSEGLSGQAPAGLAAGDYTVTVTDVMGSAQATSFSIPQPAELKVEAEVTAPASTNKSDGQATVRITGGTAPYTYRWDNGEAEATTQSLAPGMHTITITDARGCMATANAEVTENILPLTIAIQQVAEIGCFGEQNAALQVEVKGGKGPFQYQWSSGGISGDDATGLSAGDYAVTVTDVTGLSQSAQISISAPEALTVSILEKEPAFSDSSNDGKATAEAKGGTGDYSFQWDNGATGTRVENLALGQHDVTVTDSKGCSASTAFEITERIMKELASGAVRSGQTIQMQKLQFEADSTNVTDDNRPILDEIYVFLKDNPSIVVEIGGHTNNLPPPEYCDQLSTARARAVAEYLVQQGIDPERVFYKGYGKRKPLFSNATEDGRRRNQRVEIKILRL